MSLPWVRLDTQMPSNPKLLAMLQRKDGHRAAFAWVCGLSYTGAHGLDGFLTKESLPFIHCRNVDAALLVHFGLWKTAPGGWQINGWDEKQQSSDETKQRRVRAQAAAQARWSSNGDGQ